LGVRGGGTSTHVRPQPHAPAVRPQFRPGRGGGPEAGPTPRPAAPQRAPQTAWRTLDAPLRGRTTAPPLPATPGTTPRLDRSWRMRCIGQRANNTHGARAHCTRNAHRDYKRERNTSRRTKVGGAPHESGRERQRAQAPQAPTQDSSSRPGRQCRDAVFATGPIQGVPRAAQPGH
jgi:hypothetical protein